MRLLSTISMIIAGIFLFASCDLSSDLSNEPGTMKVLLTDAPGDYEEVWIDVQEVRVHKQSDAEEEDNGWRTINDQPVRLNLLELTNGNYEILGEAELEPGSYNQMRLILGDQNELVINGETHHLSTPSAQQSGLKLQLDAEIEGGSSYTLLLDFDASRSIVKAGNSGRFNLKPVIKAVNLAQTGAIGGAIEPAEALPWVYAISDDDTLGGTQASDEGDFLIIGLQSGSYQISVKPSSEDFNSTVISNIEVSAPDTTVIDTVSLEAAGGE
ncbi:hypothetical protein CWD77_08505 [Rhodohalobacter barkolensis]|uniref:DUF4382 domain-containing protein n=2 Tax=Rhodohalobacter barkolensis TaxID=2053187 RepID=A0A2N0VHD3_9BACT|nr:hypothetical protein CWD77_08505 [Rhodohalobacter barkolensis]